MPINVFGYSNSNDIGNEIDTSLFVQKPYLRTNYLESNIKENIHLKNQFNLKIYRILLVLEKQLQKNTLIKFSKMILIAMMLN